MSDKSYPTIEVSKKTLSVMKLIGNSPRPVTPKELESELNIKYATLMTHIATLETEGLIEKKEDGYVPALELAKIWAMKKAQTARKYREIQKEYNILKGDENGIE